MQFKKGFFSIQMIISMTVFILMLFVLIASLIVKANFFFKKVEDKNFYATALKASENLDKILYIYPSYEINKTTLKKIISCSRKLSHDPESALNNEYSELHKYMKLDNHTLFTISLTRYLIMSPNEVVDKTTKKGIFNSTTYYIKRNNEFSPYSTLTINSKDYSLKDIIQIFNSKYILDSIDTKYGNFVILKNSIKEVCGSLSHATYSKSIKLNKYSVDNETLYHIQVVIWQ